MALQPEYPWDVSRFIDESDAPSDYLRQRKYLLKALASAAERLSIKQVSEIR